MVLLGELVSLPKSGRGPNRKARRVLGAEEREKEMLCCVECGHFVHALHAIEEGWRRAEWVDKEWRCGECAEDCFE